MPVGRVRGAVGAELQYGDRADFRNDHQVLTPTGSLRVGVVPQ